MISLISYRKIRWSEPPSLPSRCVASGRGDTALLQAAARGETAVVELLLAANAPADVKNENSLGPQFGWDPFGSFLDDDRLSRVRNP